MVFIVFDMSRPEGLSFGAILKTGEQMLNNCKIDMKLRLQSDLESFSQHIESTRKDFQKVRVLRFIITVRSWILINNRKIFCSAPHST